MKMLYLKYQWFYLIIFFIFFGISLFYYVQENQTTNNLVFENKGKEVKITPEGILV